MKTIKEQIEQIFDNNQIEDENMAGVNYASTITDEESCIDELEQVVEDVAIQYGQFLIDRRFNADKESFKIFKQKKGL